MLIYPSSDGSGWISNWLSMDSTDHIQLDVFSGQDHAVDSQ
jgi:hypothetical protein